MRERSAFGDALRLLPPGIARLLGRVDLVVRAHPVFVGLYPQPVARPGSDYGYPTDVSLYPHVSWELHQRLPLSRRYTTVVLPDGDASVDVVLHELGHVLQERVEWRIHRIPDELHVCPTNSLRYDHPVTQAWEAWADAFAFWVSPDACFASPLWADEWRPDAAAADHETRAAFQLLERGP